ncbi:unnamed protein product [Notodromas monacha]|uniref:Uncharacterized protein n=1 Tax=Notodromas monacha TaxID=399045 RepID=A0A7R9BJA1_9CRUS|nr:unnamed protein product [Notodromas monacha]CAG0916550.1 unnamed protein product [Notodromas monacha]
MLGLDSPQIHQEFGLDGCRNLTHVVLHCLYHRRDSIGIGTGPRGHVPKSAPVFPQWLHNFPQVIHKIAVQVAQSIVGFHVDIKPFQEHRKHGCGQTSDLLIVTLKGLLHQWCFIPQHLFIRKTTEPTAAHSCHWSCNHILTLEQKFQISVILHAGLHQDTSHQVLRLTFKNEQAGNKLFRELNSKLKKPDLDVWRRTKREADILVPPDHFSKLREIFLRLSVTWKTLIQDVEREKSSQCNKRNSQFDLNTYNKYNKIHAWLDIVAAAHPSATSTVIGKSFEGREIKVIKINTAGAKNVIGREESTFARINHHVTIS